jgi:hypothetical protein
MPTLTDTQLVLLTKALQRPDEALVIPETLKGAAATKVVQSLLDRGLIRLIEAGPAMPVWRRSEDGTATALVLSPAGRALLGVADADPPEAGLPDDLIMIPPSAEFCPPQRNEDQREGERPARAAPQRNRAERRAGPSKKHVILELLQRQSGASLTDITAATGWLPHTARAELTRLRQGGHAIVRGVRMSEAGEEEKVYRLSGDAPAAGGEA